MADDMPGSQQSGEPAERPERRRREYRRQEDRRRQDDQLVALLQLSENVQELSDSVVALRREIGRRPTATEISNRRRRTIAAMLVGLLAVVFIFDTHVEQCAPGARAEEAIAAVVSVAPGEAGPDTLARVQELINRTDDRPLCDLLTPLHGHNDEPYPTPWSIAGVMLYLISGAGLYLWARPRAPKEDS